MIPWRFKEALPMNGSWTLEESERLCMRCTVSHYENFPVVAAVAGKGARKTLAAVYCFARFADDFADEACFNGVRLKLLDEWEEQLENCIKGKTVKHPVFIALRAAIERHSLDAEPFFDLLSAFKQDCTKNRYKTIDDVLDYCSRSANPVGRIVLRVMDRDTQQAVRLSDKTCSALQLINFWQDLSVDRLRDRLYIPEDIASMYNVTLDSVIEGYPGKGFKPLLCELVVRTRILMEEASDLPAIVGFPGEFYLRAVQKGGLSILKSVEETGVEILRRRPSLTFFNMASIFIKSAKETAGRRLNMPGLRLPGGM